MRPRSRQSCLPAGLDIAFVRLALKTVGGPLWQCGAHTELRPYNSLHPGFILPLVSQPSRAAFTPHPSMSNNKEKL